MIILTRNTNIYSVCRVLCSAVLLVILVSCSGDEEDKGTVLAESNGATLYESDVDAALSGQNLREVDYDKEREEYIKNWKLQQVILNRAENYNTDIEAAIKTKIEKYKTSLLMYEYERLYISNTIDTTVSEEEIETYYKEHIKDFELDDYLVNAIFIKAPVDAPDIYKVNMWFRSKDTADIKLMEQWCAENASHFYYDNESWMYYDEVQKMLPAEMIINKKYFIVNKLARKYETEDYVYMFRVINFRTGISPLEFEKKNIKSRIIQMRIAKLREELKLDITNDAENI